MNYNRRPNRPDGNHYREMRRRGLKGADDGVSHRRGRHSGFGTLLLLIVACAVVVGFFVWR